MSDRKLRLPPRKKLRTKPIKSDDPAVATMQAARKAQKKEQKKLRNWLKDNVDFKTEGHIDKWVKLRGKYHKDLLDIVIQHMSIGDAVSAVNDTLRYGFKMEEAGIDVAEVEALVTKMFRINVMHVMLKTGTLPKEYHDDLLRRAIAREFPNRDGASSGRADRSVQASPPPRQPVIRERPVPEPTAYQQRVREMRQRAGESKIVKVREGDDSG